MSPTREPSVPLSSSRRHFVRRLAAAGLAAPVLVAQNAASASPSPAPGGLLPGWFDVRSFGAKGDGVTKDTRAIQAAIDACSRAGGGRVFFPVGRFLTGSLTLKDNVTLHLSPTAVILGSPDKSDYRPHPFPALDLDVGGYEIWALIYADGASNIGIEGNGTIDGNGKPFPFRRPEGDRTVSSGVRPRAIFLKNCRRVVLRDALVLNSAIWSVHLALCDTVLIDGLEVVAELHVNQDGIVLDSSRNVRLSRCRIRTVDDCIVFKTSFPQPCESVTVSDCVLTSDCSGIKFGTQSLGDFRGFAITNCVIDRCLIGGLKFESMDGGTLEDVTVSNIVQVGGTAPLFFRIGARGQDFGFKDVKRPRPIGVLRNVRVDGVRATLTPQVEWTRAFGAPWNARRGWTMILAGLPGHPIEDISLSNIEVTFPGTGTAEEAAHTEVPENADRYPENTMFGVLPAYGFYLRHARGVTLDNIRLDLSADDARPSLLADDVADLQITRLRAAVRGSRHALRLTRTPRAVIRDSRPLQAVDSFVHLADSPDLALVNNDLRAARAPATGAEASVRTVQSVGNLRSF